MDAFLLAGAAVASGSGCWRGACGVKGASVASFLLAELCKRRQLRWELSWVEAAIPGFEDTHAIDGVAGEVDKDLDNVAACRL